MNTSKKILCFLNIWVYLIPFPFAKSAERVELSHISKNLPTFYRKVFHRFNIDLSFGGGIVSHKKVIKNLRVTCIDDKLYIIPSSSQEVYEVNFSTDLPYDTYTYTYVEENTGGILAKEVTHKKDRELSLSGKGLALPIVGRMYWLFNKKFKVGISYRFHIYYMKKLVFTNPEDALDESLLKDYQFKKKIFYEFNGKYPLLFLGYKVGTFFGWNTYLDVEIGYAKLAETLEESLQITIDFAQFEYNKLISYLGASFERPISEYFRFITRLGCFFTDNKIDKDFPNNGILLHKNTSLLVQCGLGMNLAPDLPLCNVTKCKVTEKHMRGGNFYRGSHMFKKDKNLNY